MAYDTKLDLETGELMTVDEYLDCVGCGAFIDYDGFGFASNGTHEDMDTFIYPSDGDKFIPTDATHIMWYNR